VSRVQPPLTYLSTILQKIYIIYQIEKSVMYVFQENKFSRKNKANRQKKIFKVSRRSKNIEQQKMLSFKPGMHNSDLMADSIYIKN